MKIKKYAMSLLFFVSVVLLIISLGVGIVYGLNITDRYIYIDPGHGGFDAGTTSPINSLKEKDLTLEISIKLKEKLERFGYRVLLTRYKDTALGKTKKEDIYKRVDLINQKSTILFISIHANAYPSEIVSGAQVFYKKTDENKKLSEKIQSFLKEIDQTNHRLAKPITDKYLVDHSEPLGCLIEVGFLSNKKDLNNLTNPTYQDQLVTMITLGIVSYIGENNE